MSTNSYANIKDVLKVHPEGAVATARGLLRMGVSRETQRSLVRSGWLKRMGSGAYSVLDQAPGLDGALYALQHDLKLSIHEGGFSALAARHGKAHNLVGNRPVQLFGVRGENTPTWFARGFGDLFSLHRASAFPPDLGIVDLDSGGFELKVSGPERAMMELLYLVPAVHTLREAYQIMELLDVAKPAIIQSLLESCGSVKVKRLFLYMAELAGHAWFRRLDLARVDLGTGDREIVKGGKLDRKYKIVIDDVKAI